MANDPLGVAAYNRGDYEIALQYFQEAVEKAPTDTTILQHLQMAKDQVAAKNQRERERKQRKDREAFMQQRGLSLDLPQNFDPDGRHANALKGTGSKDLGLKTATKSSDAFKLKTSSVSAPDVITDSRIVDARNVPSGLPKFVDDAIRAMYGNAPPGVSDRVRKGFQAVVKHDWNVARAWFGDALNHDPGNPGLKRLVDLADYTEKRIERGNTGNSSGLSSAHKPIPFTRLSAAEARRLSDYVFDQMMATTESDDFRLKP